MNTIEREIRISIGPRRILSAFFEPADLKGWWRAARSACEPRENGLYLIEWDQPESPAPGAPASAVLAGVVRTFHVTNGFTVESCYWMPRDGEAVGPTVLAVGLVGKINQTVLRVVQSGLQSGKAWSRLQTQFAPGWPVWLETLQRHLQG